MTLTEAAATAVLIGLLSAIALTSTSAQIDAARYAEADMVMGAIATELKIYQLENDGQWPADSPQGNLPPEGLGNFPEMPWEGELDYEHWSDGKGNCVVFLGYAGKGNKRNWAFFEVPKKQGRDRTTGNLIRILDEYPCSNRRGAINKRQGPKK